MIGCFVQLIATDDYPDNLAGQKGKITRAMGDNGHYEVELTSGRKVRRHWSNLSEIASLEETN